MEKIISALLTSGMPIATIVLLVVIAILVYLLVNGKSRDGYVDEAIEGFKAIMQEQHDEMEALSKVVYQFKKELEAEKQKNFDLRNEILQLREENWKLKGLVAKLEDLVKELQAENRKLRGGEECL